MGPSAPGAWGRLAGVNGEPRPLWFPFQPSYWGLSAEKQKQQLQDDPGLGKPPVPYLVGRDEKKSKTAAVDSAGSGNINAEVVAVVEDEVRARSRPSPHPRSTALTPGRRESARCERRPSWMVQDVRRERELALSRQGAASGLCVRNLTAV